MSQHFVGPGIVDSSAAAEARSAVLAQWAASGEARLDLGALPDEAMVALVGDPNKAGPMGSWYPGLSDEAKQLAQSASLRTMFAFNSFAVLVEHDDGRGEYQVATQYLGALNLRQIDPILIAHRETSDGTAWLLYRQPEGGSLLRELISPEGYHAFLLTTFDDAERSDFLSWLGADLSADLSAGGGGETVVLSREQLESQGALEFLEGMTRVTTLARQMTRPAEGESQGDVCVVHTSPDRAYVAQPRPDGVTYLAARGMELASLWDDWAEVNRL